MLPKFLEAKIPDEYFKDKMKEYLEKDRVSIRDKEQLFNYEIFRSLFGPPVEIFPEAKGKLCPYCKSKVDERSSFCRICGAYPI